MDNSFLEGLFKEDEKIEYQLTSYMIHTHIQLQLYVLEGSYTNGKRQGINQENPQNIKQMKAPENTHFQENKKGKKMKAKYLMHSL